MVAIQSYKYNCHVMIMVCNVTIIKYISWSKQQYILQVRSPRKW